MFVLYGPAAGAGLREHRLDTHDYSRPRLRRWSVLFVSFLCSLRTPLQSALFCDVTEHACTGRLCKMFLEKGAARIRAVSTHTHSLYHSPRKNTALTVACSLAPRNRRLTCLPTSSGLLHPTRFSGIRYCVFVGVTVCCLPPCPSRRENVKSRANKPAKKTQAVP